MDVRNLQSLTQVTSVIARATLEPNEVTFDTQVCMMTSFQALATNLEIITNVIFCDKSLTNQISSF